MPDSAPLTFPIAREPAPVSAAPSAPAASRPASARLQVLDVTRGIALCGILFANVATITGVYVMGSPGHLPSSHVVQQLVVQQRFFPIFSFLFGIGFAMLLASAQRRSARPRLVLLRRLLFLALIGIVHQILQPGEALLPYAIVGLVVLLPLSLVPQRWRTLTALIIGAALTAIAAPMGGMALIPGLFLLGAAAAGADLPRRVEESPRPALILAGIALIPAAVFTALQLGSPETAGFDAPSALAGLSIAALLVGAIGALLHTPLRSALVRAFAPLGQMALTNYVGATVIGVLIALPFATPLSTVRGALPRQIAD